MFNFEVDIGNEVYLVMFIDRYEDHDLHFTSQVEESYKKHHRPDQVIFIADVNSAEKLYNKKEADKAFKLNIERYGRKAKITIMGFNEKGEIPFIRGIIKNPNKNNILQKILNAGLSSLCLYNNVIEYPPPGTAFLKPSQKIENFFISGHRIAQDSSQIMFVAFSLLRKITNIRSVTEIFYDTSAINYIAISIVNLVNKCQSDFHFNPRFSSFHSYGGIKDLKINEYQNSIFLISASTSDNLMKAICDCHLVEESNIISIISTTDSERNLIKVERPKCGKISDYTPKLIRKVDEYFTSEVNPPNCVTLKSKHGRELKNWPFKLLHNKDIIRCNISNSDKTKIREFAVKVTEMNFSEKNFKEITEWWNEIISWHVRANTKWIVTDLSDYLCTNFIALLEEKTKLNVKAIDIKSLADHNFNNSTDSILIYLPSIASGDVFVSANRDMRLGKHNGMRVFICNFHLFRGANNLKKFEASLSYGPDLNKYKFFCQYKINIPYREIISSWQRENTLLSIIDSTNEIFYKRKEILSQSSEGLNGFIGVHSLACDKKLDFTRHFAFWNFKYIENQVSPESVYFAIASILQEARDNEAFEGEESLAFNMSQQSLLAPDNFVRFNDPLIQSCLWRSAKDSELDYSNDNEVSLTFAEILIRLLKHRNSEKGSASLDFLFGIAIEKIKLSKEAAHKIVESQRSNACERFKIVINHIVKLYGLIPI